MSYSKYSIRMLVTVSELNTSKACLFGSQLERYKLVTRFIFAKAFQNFNIIYEYCSVQDKFYHFVPNLPLGKVGHNFTDCIHAFCLFLQRTKSGPREERTIRTGQGICLFCIVVCPMCTLMKDRVYEL
jgi:hypothetical protein